MEPKTSITDLADRVEHMDLLLRTKRNFRMQYRLAVNTLIPWLRSVGALPNKASVCEIGCGEGGVLDAFVELGTTFALGTDIAGPLLEQISSPISKALDLEATFVHHDVIGDDIPDAWKERFDIVLLRDVIEHLTDPERALVNIRRLVKKGGVVLITFPPYTSAFGGHQQLLGTKLGSIPFVHLLPSALFNGIVAKGDPMNREEVRMLHRIRCSADGIKKAASRAGFVLEDERYFGLRPVFRWKYNKPIPTVELTSMRKLGIVRALAMETAFVFRAPR